jgi:selenocysteine lyase/cysteine desulfurase
VHWADGTLIDLDRLIPSLRARGAAIVIDATQAAGALDFRVDRLDVDFVAFPAYKWLLGPYGMAFLYVSPRFQNGTPLEEHMGGRRAPALEQADGVGDLSYGEGARRFDRGERDESVLLSIAASALSLAQSISFQSKLEALCGLRDCLINELAFLPVDFAPPEFRSPHIIGIRLRGRNPAEVVELLARENVFVSARRGFLRVSPYMYNNISDIHHFCKAFRTALANSSWLALR